MEFLRLKNNRVYLRAESMNEAALSLLSAIGTRYGNHVYSIRLDQFVRWNLIDFI